VPPGGSKSKSSGLRHQRDVEGGGDSRKDGEVPNQARAGRTNKHNPEKGKRKGRSGDKINMVLLRWWGEEQTKKMDGVSAGFDRGKSNSHTPLVCPGGWFRGDEV